MDYTVKTVNSFKGHDGYGFTASLYNDNKRIGLVRDDGWGGGLDYEIPKDEYEKLNTHARSVFEKDIPCPEWNDGKPLEYVCADSFVCGLVDQYEENKQLKGWCKKKIVLITKDCAKGEYVTLKNIFSDRLEQKIKEKYGDDLVEIVNKRFL